MQTNFKKVRAFVLLLLIVTSLTVFPACDTNKASGFAIYLADTGESVLEANQIAAYYPEINTLELNARGIEKWNSYQTYPDIPKLNLSLFAREFIIKIEGREICRGKFWSNVSSSTVNSVVILDSIFKLNNENNTIRIQNSYGTAYDPVNIDLQTQLIGYFSRVNKLN